MTPVLRVGGGAGFSGDRTDVALPVVEELIACGGPAALIFETLAERTLALAQLARGRDPGAGYEPLLIDILSPVLAKCVAHGIRIIGNFGAANPRGAAEAIRDLAQAQGIGRIRIGIVEGDDLLEGLGRDGVDRLVLDPPTTPRNRIVAANAYLGAAPIAEALRGGADVVVTGRVADPSLTLGPVMHHFGWGWEDWDRLAAGTLAGHLLECGAQATGGYFADPGYKDVPDLAWVGFPIAEIHESGRIVITKPRDTGGLVSRATVTEQLLYEIHDPAAYLTPDVVLDIAEVMVAEIGPDRVELKGARGHPRPPTLKATVSVDGGYVGEAEISYAGPNAAARARLAAEVVRERLKAQGNRSRQRYDLIGVASVFNDDHGRFLDHTPSAAEDVRLRIASASEDRAAVERVNREVLALYCTGPAGGGGIRRAVTPVIHTASAYVLREVLRPRVSYLEAGHG